MLLFGRKSLPVVAIIIDIFASPAPPFESKKNGGTRQYSELKKYIILATVVAICPGHFLIQKGERGKLIILATTGIAFLAKKRHSA